METEKKQSYLSVKNGVLLLLGIGIVYGVAMYAIQQRLSVLEFEARELVSDQETILATIAETTSRNGADSVTEGIIRDCSLDQRSRFNNLLDRLNDGLPRTQLLELEDLFVVCGSFTADRRALMVVRFEREYEVFQTYVTQLGLVTGQDLNDEFAVSDWGRLVEQERIVSDKLTELVAKQDEIISALLDGNTINSEQIQNILQQVLEIRNEQLQANEQANEIRSSLVSL